MTNQSAPLLNGLARRLVADNLLELKNDIVLDGALRHLDAEETPKTVDSRVAFLFNPAAALGNAEDGVQIQGGASANTLGCRQSAGA